MNIPCARCQGTGKIGKSPCSRCAPRGIAKGGKSGRIVPAFFGTRHEDDRRYSERINERLEGDLDTRLAAERVPECVDVVDVLKKKGLLTANVCSEK